MINNKILINSGFTYKEVKCEYFSVKSWYYGPYLYLHKRDNEYSLVAKCSLIETHECIGVYDANKTDVNEIIKACVYWYSENFNKIGEHIEKLISERDTITDLMSKYWNNPTI